MPVWEVSEPYINLWLYDEPLGYQPGLGGKISFKLSYKQRETRALYDGVAGNYTGVGPAWNCSWVSYLYRNYTIETNSDWVYICDPPESENCEWYWVESYTTNYDGTATVVMGDGGQRTFTANNSTPEYYSRGSMEKTANLDGSWDTATINYVDGSKEEYSTVTTTPLVVEATEILYRTAKYDRFGNATRYYYYSGSPLLHYVVDADGRTNTLSYTGALITSVQDPFGRTATLQYDNQGWLTNITDVVGLSSWCQYDNNGWVTNLTTPYGNTRFEHLGGGFGDPDGIVRAIRVTDAVGGTNLYLLRQLTEFYDGMTFPFPAELGINWSSVGPDGYIQYRSSSHWGPRQAASLPNDLTTFDSSDFRKARIRHWLHDQTIYSAGQFDYIDGYYGLGQTLSFEAAPLTDDNATARTSTWYDYPDKTYSHTEGPESQPMLVTRLLPDDQTWLTYYERDPLGRPTNVVASYSTAFGEMPQLRTNRYVYSGADLIGHYGPNGNLENGYAYNANHQLTFHTNAAAEVTAYTYDGYGRHTSTKSAAGLTTTNIYPASGEYANFVAQVIDLEIKRTNSYTYQNNLVQTHTDERGLTVTNMHDALQRLRRVSYPDGTFITNVYDKLDLVQRTDRMGFVNSSTYDAVRRKTSQTDALNRTTYFNYCTCGAMTSMQDAAGNFTYYNYDDAGNLTSVQYPDGYSVTNTVDFLGRGYYVTDSAGISSTNWHVNQGLLYLSQNWAGTTSYRYFDIEDNPIYVTDANGVTVTNTYDALHRLATRVYPDGGVERFGYSQRGLVVYTNQLDFVTRYVYDEARRKIAETNANNEVLLYTNNAASDLLSLTDGKNQTTRWQYDEYGRVTNKLDQLAAQIFRYQYDPNSRLTNRWTPAKGTAVYQYDGVGNLTNIDYAASADVRLMYDSMNRVTNMVDAVGTTKYTYSAAGQMLTEDGPWSSDTLTNTYYHRLRVNLDLQQPTGLWTNRFTYDAARRLTSVKSPAGLFEYVLPESLPSTLAIRLDLPNTSYITNTYDNMARLTGTYLKNSGNTTINHARYGYNVGNQRTAMTNGFTIGVPTLYTYDPIGQLKVADAYTASDDRGYSYDAAWNLNWRTNNGTLQAFKVDGLNQLTNAIGATGKYDANGNLTNYAGITYAYDDENRLILVSDEVNHTYRIGFVYDGLGRLRVQQPWMWVSQYYLWTPTYEQRSIYDGMREIQMRYADFPITSYTRGTDLSGSLEGAGGIGGLLGSSYNYSGGNWSTHYYFHADGNGNVTYLANSSQTQAAYYRYDAYGNTLSSGGTMVSQNLYRFSSKQIHAASGLYYYGYRWYSPNLQRWLNRDPLMEEGGFNLYGFVHNDPLNLVDDTGERPIRPGPGMPGGRNPYRYPNGRPIYIPPLPPRQNPPNPWPNGRQPSMCITIPVMGRDMQRAGRRAEALAQNLLGDPSAPPCPPPPPSPCPPAGPSLPPYIPNSGSYVNAPPDIGLTTPPTPPRTIFLPRNGGPVIVAPGTNIIWY